MDRRLLSSGQTLLPDVDQWPGNRDSLDLWSFP